ncbi:MAG: 3-hydroxyacyl-CoA dehydrogenase NAD-binding domain-containing protein [Polyangiaceae bacterium]
MVEGRSVGFKENFLVMHFFNPVRYMKLLELVAGPGDPRLRPWIASRSSAPRASARAS